MTRYHPGFYRSCRTDETGLTRIKPPVVQIPCTDGNHTALKAPLPVDPPGCDQTDSGGGRTRTSGVSLSQIYSLLPSPLGHATGASLLPVTVRCVPCPIHLYPQTVSLHNLMGDGSGRGAAGNRTRVWPAVSHCLPSRAYPTLDAHPWTGAFGEPARLVDDVRMLAGRIHRPTVRPVRFKVFRL